LNVRRTRLSTVGDRAFPVAAARTWNSLPQHVTSAPSMSVSRSRLKAFLFRRSFAWYLLQLLWCLRSDIVIFGHFNRFTYFYLLRNNTAPKMQKNRLWVEKVRRWKLKEPRKKNT